MRAWADIATVVRASHAHGGLVVHGAANLGFLIRSGLEIALVPPVLDEPRWVHVSSFSPTDDDAGIVYFDEITSLEQARLYGQCHCLVRRADLPAGETPVQPVDIVRRGWNVYDARCGHLGTVADVDTDRFQPLLVIERENGTTTLVPFVDAIVVALDEEQQRVDLNCPAGLVDL